jgi:hypothetical protein
VGTTPVSCDTHWLVASGSWLVKVQHVQITLVGKNNTYAAKTKKEAVFLCILSLSHADTIPYSLMPGALYHLFVDVA